MIKGVNYISTCNRQEYIYQKNDQYILKNKYSNVSYPVVSFHQIDIKKQVMCNMLECIEKNKTKKLLRNVILPLIYTSNSLLSFTFLLRIFNVFSFSLFIFLPLLLLVGVSFLFFICKLQSYLEQKTLEDKILHTNYFNLSQLAKEQSLNEPHFFITKLFNQFQNIKEKGVLAFPIRITAFQFMMFSDLSLQNKVEVKKTMKLLDHKRGLNKEKWLVEFVKVIDDSANEYIFPYLLLNKDDFLSPIDFNTMK